MPRISVRVAGDVGRFARRIQDARDPVLSVIREHRDVPGRTGLNQQISVSVLVS